MSDLPETMRGVWLIGHGGLDQLDVRDDIPVPRPGAFDVVVRVGAAGINNTDVNTRTGWYSKHEASSKDAGWTGAPLELPRIQGADACGRIVAVGEQVGVERIGERVLIEPCLWEVDGETLTRPQYFGSECDGAFAEFTKVASRHAHAVETDLTDVELASFPCSYSTAENLLTRSRVGEGDRVLVTGASGGVGSAAVQLAKTRGAHVVAQTSPEKAEAVIDLGADEAVLRTMDLLEALGADGIDVVIDVVGGDQWPLLLDVLRPGGRYAVSGAIAGPLVELDLRTLYLKDLTLLGCTVLEPEVFPRLIHQIQRGAVIPLVAEVFPLEEIRAAQTSFMERVHVGKIVLEI